MKYYEFEIEFDGAEREYTILDYLSTHVYQDAIEIEYQNILDFCLNNVGKISCNKINFITKEDDNGNVLAIWYIDDDGRVATLPYNDTMTLSVDISAMDYELLEEYGFDFDRNISNYLHDIAAEMRTEMLKGGK